MKRSWVLAAGSLCWLALAPSALFATEPPAACSGQRAWVAVSAGAAGVGQRLIADLRAGLQPSGIEVCEAAKAGAPEPLARVVVTQIAATNARFSLDVTDSVTNKRIGRDLDLSRLPLDGRGLALAVAAEELLRASWAELALRGIRKPETAPPPEVRAVVAKAKDVNDREPELPRRFTALGARLAFEHFLGGQTHYGADLFAVQPVARIAGLFAALGARRALSVRAEHGTIEAEAISAELGLSLALFRSAGVELSALASARALWLSFEPASQRDATARAASGLALTGRAGLGFAFGTPGLLRSYSALGAGLPLRSFSASDAGEVVTGASKLELLATTGVALELP